MYAGSNVRNAVVLPVPMSPSRRMLAFMGMCAFRVRSGMCDSVWRDRASPFGRGRFGHEHEFNAEFGFAGLAGAIDTATDGEDPGIILSVE
jgi:hypothetical protein